MGSPALWHRASAEARYDEDVCRVISVSLCVILRKASHLVSFAGLMVFPFSRAERSERVYLLPLMFANILQREQTSFGLSTASPLMRGKAHVSRAPSAENPLFPRAESVPRNLTKRLIARTCVCMCVCTCYI